MRSGDSGAAAVEFALVLPVLLLILFGIVDYGIYFSDSVAGQSGVQNATRQASIASFTDCATPLTNFVSNQPDGAAPTPDMQAVACMVAKRTQALTGTVYVDVVLPTVSGVSTWTTGQPLLVCETIVAAGLTGFVPLPDGGQVRSKSVMTIQDPTNTATPEAGGEQTFSGDDGWAWCTL
jgi:Flp pilus assembly protein TadG